VFSRSDNLRSHQRDKGHEGHGVSVSLGNDTRVNAEDSRDKAESFEDVEEVEMGEIGMDGQPLRKRRKLVPFDLEGYR